MSLNHLILTVDYELFGNGSGSICDCVLQPTQTMASIAQQYSIPLTFFVDTIEFQTIFDARPEQQADIKLVQEQLKQLLRDQHDLQLHIHPQWSGANYVDGAWDLDYSKWRIGDLEYSEILELVQSGKQWLLELGQTIKPNYKCYAYRAGGWAIQPSHHVTKALSESGIYIDSTVAPGLFSKNEDGWFDFRDSPREPYWQYESDVCQSENNANALMWEVPITVGEVGRFKHALEYKRQTKLPKHPQGCIGAYQSSSGMQKRLLKVYDKLSTMGKVMLDFSSLSAGMMIHIVEQHLERHADENKALPIVGISHNKNFTDVSAKEFSVFCEWLVNNDSIVPSTYENWFNALQNKT